MATATRTVSDLPPLVAGDRLTQPEFHARYEQMPPGVKCELIGGVVYVEEDGSVPSPLKLRHGESSTGLAMAFGIYRAATPGVSAAENTAAILGRDDEPQPDLLLYIKSDYSGRTRVEDGWLVGPPELIIEVADTTKTKDRVEKLAQYDRAEVAEYVILALRPDLIYAYVRGPVGLQPVAIDRDAVYRSTTFPGVWLDIQALLKDDSAMVIATVQRGLASPEHAEFVARLQQARAGRLS
jgi:Uma2 family endonuclease